ncbi:Cys-tRNA(Pro)/Cys-tRNA(Cys) deacylase [Weissella beninensis]|uniref:Cys-tRNA(Pro)/Cys-tRNA(Cys) deacylase n=1 Tax=Periweissella beninensis TaxID=504936 RepID=A0ABT0VMA4_9LACO|nr:aminoacyl-tRNA deacylase [Periweissella beninensis]MBM7543924.1 Cys-tRNA(Pro)/Cys-tRNA(Cys) deacylase [Periweissella beninensis]MCM2437650.1 aminoacyl-tRNA deacylase [Periweissella beninensis]
MAKKNKSKKTLVEQILDKASIAYEPLTFATYEEHGVVQFEHGDIDEHTIYKTLALNGNKTGPVVGVVPLDWHLSEKKLAAVSGNKKVEMIPLKDLVKTTGYIHGANNPVGIYKTKHFPIFIEQEAQKQGTIIVSSGEVGRSIKIAASDLATFVAAPFVDLQR